MSASPDSPIPAGHPHRDEAPAQSAASIRCWRLPDARYLLRGEAAGWPSGHPSSIPLPNGETVHEGAAYSVVTPEGRMAAGYAAPGAFSLEDTLYVYNVYVVSEGRLLEVTWTCRWKHEPTVEVQIVLDGLVECDPGDLPFDPLGERIRAEKALREAPAYRPALEAAPERQRE